MPERCSRLTTSRSRQITWMELKQPFQIATQTRASVPIIVPSLLKKSMERITMATSPAMTAAIGSTFHSF